MNNTAVLVLIPVVIVFVLLPIIAAINYSLKKKLVEKLHKLAEVKTELHMYKQVVKKELTPEEKADCERLKKLLEEGKLWPKKN